jgi:hypothetical protein
MMEDWECDFGFRRNSENECVPLFSEFKVKLEEKAPNNCRGFYEVKTGYKKITGDFCSGGIDLNQKIIPCPEQDSDDEADEDREDNEFDELKILRIIQESNKKF